MLTHCNQHFAPNTFREYEAACPARNGTAGVAAATSPTSQTPVRGGHTRQGTTRFIRTDFTESKDKNAVCRYLLRHLGQKDAVRGVRSTREGPVEGNSERLLTPGEVAALFRVDPKTVTRWAASGRIGSIRTPGGHRPLPAAGVRGPVRVEEEPSVDGHSVL